MILPNLIITSTYANGRTQTKRAPSSPKPMVPGNRGSIAGLINSRAVTTMGGWKASGLGSRHGPGGIRKYTKQQTLLVARFVPKRDMHMLPYKGRTTKLVGRLLKLLYGRGKRD